MASHTKSATETAPGLRERKRERTRRTIGDAAFRLFAERGFEEVRLTDIATAADVAPATVFTHFRTKEEIFFSRRDDFNQGLAEVVAGAGTSVELITALETFFRSAARIVLGEDDLARARTFAGVLLASAALCDAYLVLERERRELLLAALTERAAGRTPAVDLELFASLVSAVTSAAFGARHRLLAQGAPVGEVEDGIDEVLRRGFGRIAAAYAGEAVLDAR
ncbi:helix-turn-helix domain-containing protein [Kitasatospora sp. NPDC093806]|uniref:TetR/AcrR family transcriptional regulator n=1 Tax=Kitasatospora sp. NPDC093806 TaxID=3155075 RepID=UPI00341F3AA5